MTFYWSTTLIQLNYILTVEIETLTCINNNHTETKLKGLVVWITGASSGIGEELAYQLAGCGSRLILSARREEELSKVKRRCLGE